MFPCAGDAVFREIYSAVMEGARAACLGGLVFLLAPAVLPGADTPGPAYIYTETPQYRARAVRTGEDRFPAGAVLKLVSGGRTTPLAPAMAASADACVSFDGKRVLFAGKRTKKGLWQIWEQTLAGGKPRCVITAAGDAIRPFYLPGERIVYAVRTTRGFELETAAADGSRRLRLSYAPGNYVACDVLRDGRVLFEGPHPAVGQGHDLYTVYTDGSGVETVRCDHGPDRHGGREFSSGDIVFESAQRLWRFTSALARGVEIPAPAGEIAGAGAEVPGAWLLAYRPDPRARFALFKWAGGKSAPEQVTASARTHAVQPVPVLPRPVPKIHPSSLGKREGANVLCLNVYVARRPPPADSVAAVRVWAQDDAGLPAALGQAPVERDGSFYVQVPADRPIRFELLDRLGKIVAGERGWYWMRRGEQRVCVGCHAGPEQAPENATPAVLLRSTDPVRLALPVHPSKGISR